ncbi:hypothetical protein [Polynucleobacter sp.]|uniref:hypothetical protein n=1 Tax=Polynucleobacter sp. TaxID=2029855 RepID=UPI003F699448
MPKKTKEDDLKSIELAKSIWRDRKRRVDAYLLTAKKSDPMLKVFAKELEFYEASGFMDPTGAEAEDVRLAIEKKELLKECSSLSNEDLIQKILQLQSYLNDVRAECARQYDINDYLRNYFDQHRSKYLSEVKNIKRGLNRVNDPNDQALVECINLLMNKLGRQLTGADYLPFKKLVLKTYPIQPHVKKPRITKLEKGLGEDVVAEELFLKSRKIWAESSLRNFYKKHTGLNPTTKK